MLSVLNLAVIQSELVAGHPYEIKKMQRLHSNDNRGLVSNRNTFGTPLPCSVQKTNNAEITV
jgi:hypothetical protein